MDFKEYYKKNVKKNNKKEIDLTEVFIEDLNDLDPLIQKSTESIAEFLLKLEVFYLDQEENIIENSFENYELKILLNSPSFEEKVINIILFCENDLFLNFFHMFNNKS